MTKQLFISCLIASGLIFTSNIVSAKGNITAGKEKSATCAACHGVGGKSEIPFNPTLAGQYADYIVRALKDYKSGDRQNPIMSGMTAALSDEDMEDLAAYFEAQEGLTVLPKP